MSSSSSRELMAKNTKDDCFKKDVSSSARFSRKRATRAVASYRERSSSSSARFLLRCCVAYFLSLSLRCVFSRPHKTSFEDDDDEEEDAKNVFDPKGIFQQQQRRSFVRCCRRGGVVVVLFPFSTKACISFEIIIIIIIIIIINLYPINSDVIIKS